MDREEILAIIERIGGDTPPGLAELQTAQTELARLIHAEAKAEAPKLDVLTTLRGAFAKAGTAITAEETRIEAERAQIGELTADIPDPDAPPVVEEPPAEVPPVEGEQPPAETPPAEGQAPAAEPIAAGAATPEPPKQTVKTLPLRDAVARVTVREPAPAPTGAGAAGEGTSGAESQIFVLGNEVDYVPSLRDAAAAFERVVRSPSTGKATLLRYDTVIPETQTLPGDTAGNTRVLESLVGAEAVAAAGGCCSLPTPIRSQNVLSSAARPLRDALPNIGVQDTGAVTYFPAVCLPDEGAALWTCSDDEAVDFDLEETWKECVFIDCPTADTTIVDAIYRCLTIGEFQRRFATEQWMAIIQATLALQARVADARLWARMLATVNTTHTGISTGSFYLNWYQTMQLAADSIREQQRFFQTEVQINLYQPHWTRGALSSDLVARRLVDVDNPTAVDQLMTGAAANAGVNLVTMGPDAQFIEATPQADGALQPYPATGAFIMAPQGHYSYLDGGQFDLGIEIRDLDLARENAVAAFAEGFEGLLARGCNAKRLNVAVDICDTAPGCAA